MGAFLGLRALDEAFLTGAFLAGAFFDATERFGVAFLARAFGAGLADGFFTRAAAAVDFFAGRAGFLGVAALAFDATADFRFEAPDFFFIAGIVVFRARGRKRRVEGQTMGPPLTPHRRPPGAPRCAALAQPPSHVVRAPHKLARHRDGCARSTRMSRRAHALHTRSHARTTARIEEMNAMRRLRIQIASLAAAAISVGSAGSAHAAAPLWQPLQEPSLNGWGTSLEVSPHDSRTITIAGDMFGSGSTNDSGEHWLPSTGFLMWEVADYTFHPTDSQVVWAGSKGGPYLSRDGGKSWTLMRNGFPSVSADSYSAEVEKIVFDPNDANTLLAFGGNFRDPGAGGGFGNVWRSTDGGMSWALIASIGANANILTGGFAAGSSSTLHVATTAGVYTSTDAGASWSRTSAGLSAPPNFIALHPTDPGTLWAATTDGKIYKSTDGATSWQLASSGIQASTSSSSDSFVVVSATTPDVLYAVEPTAEWSYVVYRSDDGGGTWNDILDPVSVMTKLVGGNAYYVPFGYNYMEPVWLTVDPADADVAYVLVSGYIARTSNGGQTWTDVSSRPIGGAWRGNGYQGEASTKIAWNPFNPGHMFAMAMDCGKLVRSSDYGWSWLAGASAPVDLWNGAQDVTFASDGTLYVGTGQNGNSAAETILKSSDNGKTWSYLPWPSGASGNNQAVYVLPTDSSTVWAGIGSSIYRSGDGGHSWTTVAGDVGGIFNFSVDPSSPTTFYVGTMNGVYKTTDGSTFALMNGSPRSYSGNQVVVDPMNPSVLFVASTQNAVYRFDGNRWSDLWDKFMPGAIAVDPQDDQRLAVITNDWPTHDESLADGVWISEDGGASWTQTIAGLQTLRGTTIAFNPDRSSQLIVGLGGGGYFVTDVGRSTPWGGAPRSIPGRIQAEDYDLGGEGVAFHAPMGAHGTSGVRADDVGICGAGAVCAMTTGEWLKYDVNVVAGTYAIGINAAATGAGATLHVEVNGVNVTGPIAVPMGEAGGYSSLAAPSATLAGGTQYLKVHIDSGEVSLASVQIGSSASDAGVASADSGSGTGSGRNLGSPPSSDGGSTSAGGPNGDPSPPPSGGVAGKGCGVATGPGDAVILVPFLVVGLGRRRTHRGGALSPELATGNEQRDVPGWASEGRDGGVAPELDRTAHEVEV